MKRRRLMWLALSLLALACFWVFKNREVANDPDKTASAERTKSLKLIEERILLQKRKVAPPISTVSEVPLADAAQNPNEPEKPCWEKIRDQYQTSPDYLAESRQRLNNIVGDWYYTRSAQSGTIAEESSPQGRFFLALAKAGLLVGAKMGRDVESALRLLEQVSAADPQNSAPFLYAAIIENGRGHPERAEELLREANQRSYFDSYLKDFTFALFDGVRTPSDLLAAQETWSTAPIPNYIALRDILKEFKPSNIAAQLVQDGLRTDRDRITDLSWLPVEYAVGKNLLDSYGTGSGIPANRDLLRKNPSTLAESGGRVVSKLDSTCDLESINDEVETLRAYLDRARTRGL